MDMGAGRWVKQLHPQDNYVVGCEAPETAGGGLAASSGSLGNVLLARSTSVSERRAKKTQDE
jgi:hypothetical protein